MSTKRRGPRKPRKSLLSDPWINANSPVDPKKLHALGALTLWWSACETHLLVLFTMVARA
jgi:hypothetical protein